jgi:predicted RNase H-like nuclease
MNCKQGRLNAQLRWIERCLDKLDNPSVLPNRTLSKEAKLKELDSLISKLAEAKQSAQTESDLAWLEGTANQLKQRVMATLNQPRGGVSKNLPDYLFTIKNLKIFI